MTVAEVAKLAQRNPKAPVKVKNGAGWEGEIEAAWLKPVIKSPREITRLVIRLDDLHYLIFMPPDDVRRAKNAKDYVAQNYPLAYEYIQWGERKGYHKRPTCAGREFWWDVGERRASKINCNYLVDDRMRFYFAPGGIYVSDDFQELQGAGEEVAALASVSITQIFCEIGGRTPFGGG